MKSMEQILNILLENDEVISGEEIGHLLNISRKTVWKNINHLRNIGYNIVAKSNNGYYLDKCVPSFSSVLLNKYLNKKMEVICFDSIDSTSTYARKICGDKSDDFLICSSFQTNGRGRTSNNFYSPNNGTYFSLSLKVKDNTVVNNITLKIGIAICKAINDLYGFKCQIKWVNDVYYNGYKFVGILSEAISDFESGKIDFIIIGIGINVNIESFPDELKDVATSLKIDNYNKNQLVATIINYIYDIIYKNEGIIEQFNELSILNGKEISFTKNGTFYKGIAKYVNNEGKLVVEVDNKLEYLNSGEVKITSKHIK